ncbi:hypothetical protein EVAR_95787_1 [Eumeta japonica]|uniref:Uncharacterized protein n=1 Tax=Eumeta variegata TaxID=151549 RepID=A0A4C1W0S0_EUMVA|nr:hypothetical protein EVAR_95787_1 [Eumeta japonica]
MRVPKSFPPLRSVAELPLSSGRLLLGITLLYGPRSFSIEPVWDALEAKWTVCVEGVEEKYMESRRLASGGCSPGAPGVLLALVSRQEEAALDDLAEGPAGGGQCSHQNTPRQRSLARAPTRFWTYPERRSIVKEVVAHWDEMQLYSLTNVETVTLTLICIRR